MKIEHAVLFSVLLPALTASFPVTQCSADERGQVALPKPVTDGAVSLEKTLKERRSVRDYAKQPLSLADVSQLLWAGQGISYTHGRRTAPSAGALYPLQVYLVAGNVAGLAAGVYEYAPARHSLYRVVAGDLRKELSDAALGQAPLRNAPAALVIAAVYERTTKKYGERGIRYVHMEAGHAAQNICLQAASLGLGTVVIGAFNDYGVKALLHLPENV